MLISDCCGYKVLYHDICSNCHEHCDPYEEDDQQEQEDKLLLLSVNHLIDLLTQLRTGALQLKDMDKVLVKWLSDEVEIQRDFTKEKEVDK